MFKYCIFLLCFILLTTCAIKPQNQKSVLSLSQGKKEIVYRSFYPKEYGQKKVPLLLWLHGAGERGNDNQKQLLHVVPYLLSDSIQEKYPCVLVVPQCPAEDYWSPVKRFEWSVINDGKVTPAMEEVIDLLENLLMDPKIDKDRVYVAGLSMGGFGTLDILSRKPNLFAAAFPMCGGGDTTKVHLYKEIPIWVFHGTQDPVVSVQKSRELVKIFQDLGSPFRYTEYPEGGHDIWEKAIREKELLEWVFAQKK